MCYVAGEHPRQDRVARLQIVICGCRVRGYLSGVARVSSISPENIDPGMIMQG